MTQESLASSKLHPPNEMFMRRAIALARESMNSLKGGPFGAVVVRNGEIVAEGGNSVTALNDPTAHAEVVAIRLACSNLGVFQLTDCEIYSSCEPCPMCLGAIYWSRLRAVFFGASRFDAAQAGFDDSFIYSQLALATAERSLPMAVSIGDEAAQVLREWDAKQEKRRY
ncbi:MAG TPA: nucleoside deaminase [Candidatus Angelobacter sp.]|nr:nucleoside deaminase [Candidatus Angelobacter sp.]